MRMLLTTLWVGALCLGAATAGAAERRVALVIGNSWYENADPLFTPRADAIAIANKLRALDFAVTLQTDLDQRGLQVALHDFAAAAGTADVALAYYSGHALQLDGAAYLLAVDAELSDASHLPFESVPLATLVDAVAKARRLGLVLLDAARANPLAVRLARSLGGEAQRVGRGLPSLADLPAHVVVAFAHLPDAALPDRRGEHSPYTAALLAHLGDPGVELQAMLDRVRATTQALTAGAQVPRHDGTPGDQPFYLALEALSAPAETVVPATAAPAAPPAEAAPVVETTTAAEAAPAAAIRMLEPFRDCDGCPEMVALPPASFVMGRDRGDPSERPAHEVRLARAFAIGRTEVTAEEWAACVAAQACAPLEVEASGRSPARNLSFDDAERYAAWLSATTGKAYRLPTEAEWEHAARGGTRTVYWWGDEVGTGHADCSDCGGAWDRRRPADVGSFPANPFGLLDTSGGVAEWVADCWARSHAEAPTDGSARVTRPCAARVLRGGSWRNAHDEVTSTSRLGYDAVVRYYANGLRVARDLD